jgi:hypothetical protein
MQENAPRIAPRDGEKQREIVWYACADQDKPANFVDDSDSMFLRPLRATIFAYRFYNYVHGARLWSGKRPLVLVRGCTLASRVAAFAGAFGGGDVVMPKNTPGKVLGRTRYLVLEDGSLELYAD